MLNIALADPICSGKTTIAQAFVDVLGYRRLAFADALKSAVATRHGITVAALNADKARYREDLRSYGAAMRDVNPLYWCERMGAIIANMKDFSTHPMIVDDLRYHHEAAFTQVRGFVIVAVHTPEIIRRRRHYDRYHADLPLDDESERQSKSILSDFAISGDYIGGPIAAVAEIIRKYGREIHGNA